MSDVFTETTSRGFFSRLGGSFLGILIGPLAIVAAVALLWWNEGRAVEAIVGLNAAANQTVEASADAVSPGNEGKLIHVVGAATANGPIADSDLGVNFPAQVAVARTVEMYQWRERSQSQTQNNLGGSQTTTTTYTYKLEWTDTPVDSSTFHHPEGHANPAMPFRSQTYSASDAKLGAYALDSGTLRLLNLSQPLAPDAPAGWTKNGGQLFKGDPAAPKAGDLRVGYAGLPSGTTISVLAAQSHSGFGAFVTANGYSVDLAAVGNAPAATMIANEKRAESTFTWILRGVGAFLMFLGFALFLGPISTFASLVPFLGGIVRGAVGFISFVLAVPITLTVIALAWIAYRPLIGGGLLVAAFAAFYGLSRWHAARRPATAAKPA
jgi:hypothetical protein